MLIQWPNEREEAQLLSEHYRREGNKSYPQKSVNFICAVLSLSLPRDKQKCLCMYLIQWLHSLACVDTACIRKQKSLLCDFSITTTFQGAKCIRREYLQGSLVSIPPRPHFCPSYIILLTRVFLFITKQQHGSSKCSTTEEGIGNKMYLLKLKVATCEMSSHGPDYYSSLSRLECERMGKPISLERILHVKRITSQSQLIS